MKVLDAAVRWNLQWANQPQVNFLVDHDWRDLFDQPDEVWHPFPLTGGTYWITRQKPAVRFLFEDKRPEGATDSRGRHGALGRTVRLADGGEYTTYGGWSSNAAAINKLRGDKLIVLELLPEEVVQVSCYPERWDATGFAGVSFDLSFVREQLATYAEGVDLCRVSSPADAHANSEQAAVIHSGLPLEEDRKGGTWVPYPDVSPYKKPEEGSDVFQRTSSELRYQRARAA